MMNERMSRIRSITLRVLQGSRLIFLGVWAIALIFYGSGLQAQVDREDSQVSNLKDMACYVVKPISSIIRLPDALPVDGKRSDTLRVLACRGEYEPASFILHALKQIDSLQLEATALKGDGGVIPASVVDIKVVKCWYQSGNAWIDHKQDLSKRVLIPELLLNDEKLVKVDLQKQENYVKLQFPKGEQYVWTSDPQASAHIPKYDTPIVPIAMFPVKDSPVLLPVDLAKGTNQQFWVTVKVPEYAKSGTYTGKINLFTPEGFSGAIKVELKVLPFELANPKTHYDISKDFICSVYTRGAIDPDGQGSINCLPKNEEQYRAELENLFAHGVSPILLQPEKLHRQIEMMTEVGMPVDPLFISDGPAFNYHKLVDSFSPSQRQAVQDVVKKILSVTQQFGISDVYIYGWDEKMVGEGLLKMIPVYKAIQEAGAKTFVAGFPGFEERPGQFEAVGEVLDLSNMGPYMDISTVEPDKWHSIGHKIGYYAMPHPGVENPEIHRRNYGLRIWRANYDAAMNHAYYWPSNGHIWNDFDDPVSRVMAYVYPTANGVIDTPAWEGYREGMDDIRYATTLSLAIAKYKKSRDPKMHRAAFRAEKWLNEVDLLTCDLDDVRLTMIDHIIKLSEDNKK